MRKFLIAICTGWLGLVPSASRGQDDVKKQLEALQKQMDQLQKTLKDIQSGQVPAKDVESLKKGLENLENLQKTVGAIDQRTAPRAAPINYRAEILGANTQLYSHVGVRRGGPILSPYLNLVRGVDNGGVIDTGIDYGLNTRAEFARRSDAALFSAQINQLQQQVQQPQFGSGISTTGYPARFDQSYGRPAQQLYRRGR